MVAHSVPTYSRIDLIVLSNSLYCERDYCIIFLMFSGHYPVEYVWQDNGV